MHLLYGAPFFSPFLLALLFLEVGVVVVGRRREIFDLRMSLANLTIKKLRLLALLPAIPVSFAYAWLYRHTGPLHLPWSALGAGASVATFLLVDLSFYVFHRAAHGWNLIWSTHVVHHQSTDFNLSLSGRDGVLEVFFLSFFFLPLAVIGISPLQLAPAAAAAFLVMGAVHCHVIGRLGPLEWLLNTPSHHRVHHRRELGETGTRNFGAVLILWDRLFGTFLEEGDQPFAFGVAHEAPLLDPWRSQVYCYQHLAKQVRRAPAGEKLPLLFAKPLPSPPPEPPASGRKPSLAALLAALLVFDLLVGFVLVVLEREAAWSLLGSLLLALSALGVLIGRMLSGRRGMKAPALLGLAGALGALFSLRSFRGPLWPGFFWQLAPVLTATSLVLVALRISARGEPA